MISIVTEFLLRAIRELKVKTLNCVEVVWRSSQGLANISIWGKEVIVRSRTSDIALKKVCQKFAKIYVILTSNNSNIYYIYVILTSITSVIYRCTMFTF